MINIPVHVFLFMSSLRHLARPNAFRSPSQLFRRAFSLAMKCSLVSPAPLALVVASIDTLAEAPKEIVPLLLDLLAVGRHVHILEKRRHLVLVDAAVATAVDQLEGAMRPEFRPRRPTPPPPPPPPRSSATAAATPGSGPRTWRAARLRPGDGTRGNRRRRRCHRTRARRHPRTGRTLLHDAR